MISKLLKCKILYCRIFEDNSVQFRLGQITLLDFQGINENSIQMGNKLPEFNIVINVGPYICFINELFQDYMILIL